MKGKCNSADVLSRLSVGPTQFYNSSATKLYASEAVPSALTANEVELANKKDPTLNYVRDAVETGRVFWGNIMPESQWKQTLSLAHEGHQGIVYTKSR